MDKNQIYRIIVGLVLIPIGLYLYFLRVNYIISSSVTILGTTLVISGIKYKERTKYRGLTGKARQSYLASTYFKIFITGTVIILIGLGGAAIENYIFHAKALIGLFLVIVVVGMLVLFIGRAFRGKALEAVDKAEEHM